MRRTITAMNAAAVIACVAVIALGFFLQYQSRKSPSVNFLVAFDTTPDYVDQLLRQAASILPALMNSSEDKFALYAVDHATSLISTKVPQDSGDAARVLRGIPTIPQTYLADYFDSLVPVVKSSTLPVIVIVFTDGLSDEESHDAENRISTAALQLKSCSALKALILCGVTRDVRVLPDGKVRTGLPELLRILQGRVVVLPNSTLKPAQVISAVKSVRQSLYAKELNQ